MLYVGLMSGTSLDGIDAALVDFSNSTPSLIHALTAPMPEQLHSTLLTVCSAESIEYKTLAYLDVEIARLSAGAIKQLLQEAKVAHDNVTAIGSHGQTIFHYPEGDCPTTLQVGDPNVIAELTGITTVGDIRRRDVAAKGQGAPLVPALHQAVFSSDQENRIVLNIGGIANITHITKDNPDQIIGFDTGPGNGLMDYWRHKHFNDRYDNSGNWAASGNTISHLLEIMLMDGYLTKEPPKSTGREYFNAEWLHNLLQQTNTENCNAADIQATLCEFTATTIHDAIVKWGPDTDRVIVCGGGAYNAFLLSRLETLLNLPIEASTNYGIAPDWVEATAFAWFAKQTLDGRNSNLPSVTGATHPVILGGIYQK